VQRGDQLDQEIHLEQWREMQPASEQWAGGP
jgi:hypothetical protein